MKFVLLYCGIALVLAVLVARRSWRAQDREDIIDHGWSLIGYIFAVLVVIVAVVAPSIIVGDSIGCRNAANNLGLPHRWSVSAGCYYQLPDGTWWPSGNIRNVDGQLRVRGDIQP